MVSFDDLRLDPVTTNDLGLTKCGSSTSLAEPLSLTTSGHGSTTDTSNTPTTISLTSSESLKSHPTTSGTSSSAFSSHGTGRFRGSSRNTYDYRADYHDDDEDEDDEEEYGAVDCVNEMTTLEIVLPHELLEKNLQIRVAPDVDNFDIIYKSTFHKTNPIIMYCFERYDDKLSETDIAHLDQLRQLMPSTPILFAHIVDFDPAEQQQTQTQKAQAVQSQAQPTSEKDGNYLKASESLWKQLCDLGFFQETASSLALQAPLDRQQKRLTSGYYIINDRPFNSAKQNADYGIDVRSRFLCNSYEFCYFVDFFRSILKSNLVVASTLLNEIHNQFIQYFIFSAFDMTWNLNYSIPKRLEYAKSKEAELYMSLMGIANRKQGEIQQLIGEMVDFMREDILEQASSYVFLNPNLNKNTMVSANNLKDCIDEIQEFVFVMLNRAIAVKLISSVDVMRETFIGKC